MLQQIGHRDFHHIGKWLGVQAHEKHCDGQQGHDREFTRVDVGEWMVILGAVKYDFVVGLLAASALIFGAAYTLWMFKRVYLGPVTNDDVKELTDINAREFTVMALLAIAVLYMGLYPKPFTDVMEVSVANLLQHVAASKLP